MIVNAYAGSMPWKYQKQRNMRKQAGYQWNLGFAVDQTGREYTTGGWTVVSPDHYEKNPKKPQMVRVQMFNGRATYVPVGDVRNYIGFQAMSPEQITLTIAAEIEKSWEVEQGKGRYYTCPGVGHIGGIRYNPSTGVMEVAFKDGATVTFLDVPKELYLELEQYGISGSMMLGVDSKQRHLQGIRFWDLVRIRGQHTGARYPFTTVTTAWGGAGDKGSTDAGWGGYNADAQQFMDAQREATADHQPVEDVSESKEHYLQRTKEVLSTKYDGGQQRKIKELEELVDKKYEVGSAKHDEMWTMFEKAVREGIGSVNIFSYNLRHGNYDK